MTVMLLSFLLFQRSEGELMGVGRLWQYEAACSCAQR